MVIRTMRPMAWRLQRSRSTSASSYPHQYLLRSAIWRPPHAERSPHQADEEYVNGQIKSGAFSNVSEVVPGALRMIMEDDGAKAFYRLKAEIGKVIAEAEAGDHEVFDPFTFDRVPSGVDLRVRLTRIARQHLAEARIYTESTWGEARWLRYFTVIAQALDRIAENPDCGQQRDRIDWACDPSGGQASDLLRILQRLRRSHRAPHCSPEPKYGGLRFLDELEAKPTLVEANQDPLFLGRVHRDPWRSQLFQRGPSPTAGFT